MPRPTCLSPGPQPQLLAPERLGFWGACTDHEGIDLGVVSEIVNDVEKVVPDGPLHVRYLVIAHVGRDSEAQPSCIHSNRPIHRADKRNVLRKERFAKRDAAVVAARRAISHDFA